MWECHRPLGCRELPGDDPSITSKTPDSVQCKAQQLLFDLIPLFRQVKSNHSGKTSFPMRVKDFQKKNEFRTLEWLKSGQSGERSDVPTAHLSLKGPCGCKLGKQPAKQLFLSPRAIFCFM